MFMMIQEETSSRQVVCTIGADQRNRAWLEAVVLAWVLIFVANVSLANTKIVVMGDTPANGIFDPTVEYASDASEGWLAYSAVFGGLTPFGPHVETHLARTTDAGATWTFDSIPNTSFAADLDMGGGILLPGVWNYEVSSLVHDPDDPGAEWKLFSHRVFRKTEDNFTEEQNLPAYSWISYRTAADPAGPWSPEIALLSSGPLPPAPYDNVAIAVNSLDPSLTDLVVYSEPGAFYHQGTIYLSLTGLKVTGADRIVLLASDDHGTTWRYVGTPLSNFDAPPLGHLSFDGSAIVSDRGRIFLLVTPESPGILHDGTLAFEFDSIADGTLVRAAGVPVVMLDVPAQSGLPVERRGGQADYHALNAAGGLLQPAIHVEDLPEMFQFVSTHMSILPTPVPALSPNGGQVIVGVLAVVGALVGCRRMQSQAHGGREAGVIARARVRSHSRRGRRRARPSG
jgi:hypothetical protein